MSDDATHQSVTDQDTGAADAASAAEAETAELRERVDEAVALARDESFDAPVGAEEFVLAVRELAAERDELFAKLQRTAADYQNFQRRAANNEREARELTRAGVVSSILSVVDYFDMAMSQNPETATVQQVIGGVQLIKTEMLRVLATHGVNPVQPERGAPFDPVRHEAIEHAPAEGIEPGSVAECRSPGFTLGDRLVRPAKVVVAAEAAPAPADDAGEA